MLFELGHVVATNGVAMRMRRDPKFAEGVERSLRRHSTGDWGDLEPEDKEMNDAVLEAERNGEYSDSLFSLYNIDGVEIYIITEVDRSATTVLFPEEY